MIYFKLFLIDFLFQRLRRDIEENHRTVVDSTKHEYEATRLEQERRYNNEISALKEKLTIDQQNWEENYMKKQEALLANKERELREQMKQERDREIERIIAQFENDTTSTQEEAEHTADTRVK
jgi:5-azacytidine-induced protein 1